MPSKTKSQADYRQRAKTQFCKNCSMFRKPNACTLVKGFIYPTGSCKFWEAKR